MNQVQVFHYKIIEILPIEKIVDFSTHYRLRVFFEKGCVCVKCGLVATQIILGQNKVNKSHHWDVYTDDFYPLTVDHIIPKSKGGSDEMENLQPMCARCNFKKGNGEKHGGNKKKPVDLIEEGKYYRPTEFSVGDIVYKKQNKKILGKIIMLGENPQHPIKEISAMVEEKPGSWFSLKNLYMKKEEEVLEPS